MYPDDYTTGDDDDDRNPYSSKDTEWHYERDYSTGSYFKVRHCGDGTSEYDFGKCGKVKYDKYGNEC